MINHLVVYKLYPEIVKIIDETAYDKDDNVIEYNKALVEAEAAKETK